MLVFWEVLLVLFAVLFVGNAICRLKGKRPCLFQKTALLSTSLVMLGLTSMSSLVVFLAVSLYCYAVCVVSGDLGVRCRRILLIINIPVLFLPLVYYKYAGFVCEVATGNQYDVFRDVIIPVGISFYSFQIVGFMIDTLAKGEKVPTLGNYMLFCAYFPQIVAGPIERRDDLLPQMQELNLIWRSENVLSGCCLIVLGLFYKIVMADNLAQAFWPDYHGNNACIVWLNNIIFGLRIYFDFAGYGITAYGIARCMGVKLRMNFKSPYTASSITEFWRRWHTSLTLWFRDYVYIPLKGNRTRLWWLNILVVFTISGIWHGAGWNFIIWGLLSGAAMVVHRLFSGAGLRLPALVGWGITMWVMSFIWMFFYAVDTKQFLYYLQLITSWENYDFAINTMLMPEQGMRCMAKPFMFLSALVIGAEYVSNRLYGNPYALFCKPVSVGVMVYLLVLLYQGGHNPFIYFSF